MKFFTKAARLPARPALARAFGMAGAPLGEWPASYEAQVRGAMLANPVAQRAVRLVSEGVGGAALTAGGGGEDPLRADRLI